MPNGAKTLTLGTLEETDFGSPPDGKYLQFMRATSAIRKRFGKEVPHRIFP
jgi:hypothetical protein